jgi:hypothetical protein
MNKIVKLLALVTSLACTFAHGEGLTELSCDDFKPTPEALERYKNLEGACEAIIERDGELYAKFTAIVRRVRGSSVTLHLPATDHTFVVRPESGKRITSGNRKFRPRELENRQELSIYLSVESLARPNITDVAFMTEEQGIVQFAVYDAPTLPVTAGIWPAVLLLGTILLAISLMLRTLRVSRNSNI